LRGRHPATLDDMGRISLPRRLRDVLGQSEIILLNATDGLESCLWLYTVEQWDIQERDVLEKTDRFSSVDRVMLRRLVGSIEEVSIDRQGRISIPQLLREDAGLSKDCIVMGQGDYIEIWAKDRYDEYKEATKGNYRDGLENLSARRSKGRDLGDGGNCAHSGAAGADAGMAGPEGGGRAYD